MVSRRKVCPKDALRAAPRMGRDVRQHTPQCHDDPSCRRDLASGQRSALTTATSSDQSNDSQRSKKNGNEGTQRSPPTRLQSPHRNRTPLPRRTPPKGFLRRRRPRSRQRLDLPSRSSAPDRYPGALPAHGILPRITHPLAHARVRRSEVLSTRRPLLG